MLWRKISERAGHRAWRQDDFGHPVAAAIIVVEDARPDRRRVCKDFQPVRGGHAGIPTGHSLGLFQSSERRHYDRGNIARLSQAERYWRAICPGNGRSPEEDGRRKPSAAVQVTKWKLLDLLNSRIGQ